ncbi:MAG: hypothetical protein PVF27_05605 [Gemmatimonadales bacterium]|jgi:hypothetical protein
MTTQRLIRSAPWLLLGLAAVMACQRGPSEEVQRQLDQLAAVRAEKDSLFNEVVENARLMNEIDAALNQVEGVGEASGEGDESPVHTSRSELLEKVRVVTTRLERTEERLGESRRRLRRLSAESDSLEVEIASLERSVADFQELVENQRNTIESLSAQVEELETANLALHDTLSTMDERMNTAYYVVGTEEELLERGIIVKEGGARFLFIFGKRGETLRPAHDLDPSQFTAIDLREVTTIALPQADEEYRIASRQAVEHLATPLDEDGTITGGTLEIARPDAFWTPSRFLIIVKA